MQRFQINNQSWRKRSMSVDDMKDELPIYNPSSTVGRREFQSLTSRSLVKYTRVHLIPLVVILCFFILWLFSYPVDLRTKDGRTIFVRKTRKPHRENGKTDVDLTVLALDNPPDAFFSVFSVHNKSNASFLESRASNTSLSNSHAPYASISVLSEPSASFLDSHEPSASFTDLHEAKASFVVPHEQSISSPAPASSNEAAPQPSRES